VGIQHNHLAEIAFSILSNRGRAMMAQSYVPKKFCYIFCKEAFKTATILDGLQVVEIDGKAATQLHIGEIAILHLLNTSVFGARHERLS
jgi:hypothetical protein